LSSGKAETNRRNSLAKPYTIPELNKLLKSKFGEDSVLTSIEHLYVYSYTGKFGIKKQSQPQAILKIKSSDESRLLDKLINEIPGQIIQNDDLENVHFDPAKPFVLVDVQKPIGIDDLMKSLDELASNKKEHKTSLKQASSFHGWFSTTIQGKDGFKVGDDRGFCVVQSYFDGVQTYSSKGRLLLARGLLKGELENSPLLSDSIFSCTACGQCYDQYSSDVFEINNALLKTRNKIVERSGVSKRFQNIFENIKVKGNPQGLPVEDRTLWFEEQAGRFLHRDNEILYWAGCTTSYRLPEIVDATTSVMDKIGLDFGVLGEDEGCCGLILYLSGQWSEAQENANVVLNTIGDAETLVTNCAGCFYMFSRIYPSLGVDISFNVLHTSQLLDRSIKKNNLKLRPLEGNYMWHDPCDLGRHCQVYAPPRNVLNSIPDLNLIEHPLTEEHTICCGAGGGLWTYNEELTEHVSYQKIIETVPSSLDGVITGCPTCLLSMRNTARVHRPGLKLYDLAEIVDRYLI
jgi:Fe-S oxidoreductase